jgi:hypothetical protein
MFLSKVDLDWNFLDDNQEGAKMWLMQKSTRTRIKRRWGEEEEGGEGEEEEPLYTGLYHALYTFAQWRLHWWRTRLCMSLGREGFLARWSAVVVDEHGGLCGEGEWQGKGERGKGKGERGTAAMGSWCLCRRVIWRL